MFKRSYVLGLEATLNIHGQSIGSGQTCGMSLQPVGRVLQPLKKTPCSQSISSPANTSQGEREAFPDTQDIQELPALLQKLWQVVPHQDEGTNHKRKCGVPERGAPLLKKMKGAPGGW